MAAPTLAELTELVGSWTSVDLERIDPDVDLQDLGLESRDLAGLLIEIEDRYGLQPSPADLMQVVTVGDLYRVFRVRAGEPVVDALAAGT